VTGLVPEEGVSSHESLWSDAHGRIGNERAVGKAVHSRRQHRQFQHERLQARLHRVRLHAHQLGSGEYTSGGVNARVRYNISEQGNLTYTTSVTDLGIAGNGMMIVTNGDGTPFLTRAGAFVPDGSGNLINGPASTSWATT
jgi:flagellar basal body rod protein FlgG